jgi:hypothetical protein
VVRRRDEGVRSGGAHCDGIGHDDPTRSAYEPESTHRPERYAVSVASRPSGAAVQS